MQEIVLAHIIDIEQGQQLKKLPPLADGGQKQQPERGAEHGGLGISAAIKQRQETAPVESSPLPAPVVVQVGNASPTGTAAPLGDLDRLALYIVKGDDFLRDMRKRTTTEILRASANTDEEFKVLVARLEEIVAIKTKSVAENSPINKIARIAFNKLSSFLRED